MNTLFDKIKIGPLTLENRIFMAPMTRSRSNESGIPSNFAIEYYEQRSSAGLIISEATQVSARAKGFINTPGIYNSEQIDAWKKITEAVHRKGGKIFCQLWHVGRVSHNSLLPDNVEPVAPSAIRANAQTFTANGFEYVSEPRALELNEIEEIIQDYKVAAESAKKAGFDGVELHAANGYLIDQFIRDGSNKRTDNYGGSKENRSRFLLELIDAIKEIYPSNLIGVRLTPTSKFNDMDDSDPLAIFGYLYEELNKKDIAYLHVCENMPGMTETIDNAEAINKKLRDIWKGFYIVNGGINHDKANEHITTNYADAVAFGRLFVANPDLPERFRNNEKLNDLDVSTLYGGDHRGYTDYKFLKKDK